MTAEKQSQDVLSRRVLIGLAVSCIAFGLAEFTYEKHPHVRYEGWIGFFVFASVGAILLTVACSHLMRGVLQQEADYYDD